MAIRKDQNRNFSGELKILSKKLGELKKQKEKKEKKMSSFWGLMSETDPVQVALLGIAFLFDFILGLFQIISVGFLGFLEWIVKICIYAAVGILSLALILISGVKNKDLVGIVLFFFGSFLIEIIPFLSALPALTAFVLRLLVSVNKAKLKKEVDRLDKEIGVIKNQIKRIENQAKQSLRFSRPADFPQPNYKQAA